MKILWILLITSLLDAKILEVKQLFNIQKVAVKKISFGEKKSFYAKTEIADDAIKAVTLRYDGFINKLFVDKKYQFVKKDQHLFNIYSKEALAIHQEFLVSRQISKSAKLDAIRKLQLLELKRLTKIRKPIYNFDILSPFEGYVIEKNILEGESIKMGKTILKIADLSKLWVIAKVYQKDISFIQKSMKAQINIDGFKPSFATVDFIYPKVNKEDQTISVRLILDNHDLDYYPNLFAKVEFKKETSEILSLPKSAVLQKNGKSYVFVLVGKDGEFEPKEIKAKRLHSNKYQIISGLGEGEIVIDNTLFMLDSDAITNALYDSGSDDDW